jgi:uncharacterized protein (DUF2141 family)
MIALGLSYPVPVDANLKGNLTIAVSELKNQQGFICFKVFSGAKGFPNGDENAIRRQCQKIQQIPVTVTFSKLNSGSYAVAVFHDLNGDRQLNRNSLGMPTEGYGFSRNPVVRTGPPQFGAAAIVLAGPSTQIQIRMQYSTGG